MKLIKADWTWKEGLTLWLMYVIWFLVGYYSGWSRSFNHLVFAGVVLILTLALILTVGKREKEK